jgi:hypothetical protein
MDVAFNGMQHQINHQKVPTINPKYVPYLVELVSKVEELL